MFPVIADLSTMQNHVQYLLLLSKVHHEKGVFDKSSDDLVKVLSSPPVF